MAIGILALQGDFEAHRKALEKGGAVAREVRTAEEVLAADALVLPGGESTTLFRLMEGTGIPEAIRAMARSGRPLFGTCAGAILLSRQVQGPDREGLGLLDAVVRRNAYGRQRESTVVALTDVDRDAFGASPLEAVFIRAPRFVSLGAGVDVLARRDGDPVLVQQDNVLASTFHPELTDDPRVVALFLKARVARGRAA